MRASLSRQNGGGAPAQAAPAMHFHLEGAVVTQDLLDQMNAIGQAAATQGAAAGSIIGQAEFAAAQTRKLGRFVR